MKFTELQLPGNILSALERMGYEELTPIQEATYDVIASGRDLCGLAETGSGKTAACAIPLIQMVDPDLKAIQGLVVVPTRELGIQYVEEIHNLAKDTNVKPFTVYGGFDKDIQIAKIKHGVHILIATPGRLIDLMYDGIVDLTNIRCAILDEADELLDAGFLEDIELILSCILHEHQTLLFAATMDPTIKKLAQDYLHDPVDVALINQQARPKSLRHYFCYVHPKDKRRTLIDYLVAQEEADQVIFFCNARHLVDKLHRELRKDFDEVEYIHAGISQEKRSSIFWRFRKQKIRFLIATDVAGRGLDFSRVSHVINWDFPGGSEQYTHRTGRAGRMGRKGTALTFVTKRDLFQLKWLLEKNKILPRWVGQEPSLENLRKKPRNDRRGGGNYRGGPRQKR